jgi:hypothetical protein
MLPSLLLILRRILPLILAHVNKNLPYYKNLESKITIDEVIISKLFLPE